jgi:hypothetical protein
MRRSALTAVAGLALLVVAGCSSGARPTVPESPTVRPQSWLFTSTTGATYLCKPSAGTWYTCAWQSPMPR